MFCTNCGTQAANDHSFCSTCGSKLARSGNSPTTDSSSTTREQLQVNRHDKVDDWRMLTSAKDIFTHPQVVERIKRISGLSSTGMPASVILEQIRIFDSKGASKVAMGALTEVVLPFYSNLGIKKESEVSSDFPFSYQEALVAVLCSLASRSQPLRDLRDASNGFVVDAQLPASVWAWKGDFIITLENVNGGTRVCATINIPGQMFDWGKSNRTISNMFEDVNRYSQFEL